VRNNDHHQKHVDGFFASATKNFLEEIASILGRDEFFLVEMTIVEWQSD
jgi:hypothetical protein